VSATPARRGLQPAGLFDAPAIGYSHAVATEGGRLVHIAGQVAEAPTPAEEVEAALRAIDACCREAGGTLHDVVWMTWYTTEDVSALWSATADIRGRLLGDPPPAATSVRVVALANPRYHVEITAVAVVPTAPPAANHEEEPR